MFLIVLVFVILLAEPIWVSGRVGYCETLHHKSSFTRVQVLYAFPLSDPSSDLLRRRRRCLRGEKYPHKSKEWNALADNDGRGTSGYRLTAVSF